MLPGKSYTPEVILEAAWRHRWLIVLPVIVATAAIVPYSLSLPDLYRSETLVLAVPQRIPETYVRTTVTSRIEERLRSMNEQILSRTTLEPVMLDFNLYPAERARRPMEEVVDVMRGNINVAPVRNDSFRVAFVANDAITAAKVANHLANIFIKEDLRVREVQAQDTSQFLESELSRAKDRLVDHERKLEEFRLRHAGELPSQFQSNLQVLQATQNQQQSLAESINRDRDRRLLFERSLTESDGAAYAAGAGRSDGATMPQPLQGNRLIDELEMARAELRTLEQRLKPTHPDLIAKKRATEQLEAQLATEDAATPGTEPRRPVSASEAIRRNRIKQIQAEIDKIDAQVAAKDKEMARLQQVTDEFQRRVEAVPTRETELTELMRDYDTLQKIYTGLLTNRESSNIAVNLEQKQIGEQFRILDPARPPERPFSPNRLILNLTGTLGGLVFGLSLAVLLEYRDTSVRSEEDIVRTFSLPVLAVIPFMESPRERRLRRLRAVLMGVVGLVGLAGAAGAAALGYGVLEWPL